MKNNCYLITKYRSKYIPPIVRNISDKVIDDTILFPQVSISLAKISDLMIHFQHRCFEQFILKFLQYVFINHQISQ